MRVLDPGHWYSLNMLDGPGNVRIRFVKREGAGYPGNAGRYAGTNVQEVLRACVDRLGYLNNQIPDVETRRAMEHLIDAIHSLEVRAAKRHGRKPPGRDASVFGPTCSRCRHVGCKGKCHEKNG